MSRNLGSTCCYFCGETVKLDEPPRPITREDAGIYYDTRDGYGYAGMIVANASCTVCEAQYLADIDKSACAGFSSWQSWQVALQEGQTHRDLSFRSTFNDEPGIADMPKYKISWQPIKVAWPTCEACGKPTYQDGSCMNWRECKKA